jgi:hypothetical protein
VNERPCEDPRGTERGARTWAEVPGPLTGPTGLCTFYSNEDWASCTAPRPVPASTPAQVRARVSVPAEIEQRFQRVVEQSYEDMLAYARRRLHEPEVAKRDDRKEGERKKRTRFEAEACVNEAVAILLEKGGYATCKNDDEMKWVLTATVKNRVRRAHDDRDLRIERQQPLPSPKDDDWDDEANSRLGWHDSRDRSAFPEEVPTDETVIDAQDPSDESKRPGDRRYSYIQSNIPDASVYVKIKDRQETAHATRIDLKRAFLDEEIEDWRVQAMLVPGEKYGPKEDEVLADQQRRLPHYRRGELRYDIRRAVAAARGRLRATRRLEAYEPETHKPPAESAETLFSRRWGVEFRAEFRKALRLAVLVLSLTPPDRTRPANPA